MIFVIVFENEDFKIFGLKKEEGDNYYRLSSIELDNFVYDLVIEYCYFDYEKQETFPKTVSINKDEHFYSSVFDFLTKHESLDEVEKFLLPGRTEMTKEQYISIKMNEKERLNPSNAFISGFNKRIDEFLKLLKESSRKSYRRFLTLLEVHMFDYFKDKTCNELSLEVLDSYIDTSIKKRVKKKPLLTSLSVYKRFFEYFRIEHDRSHFKAYKQRINEEIIEEQKLLTREELETLDNHSTINRDRTSFFYKAERIYEIYKNGAKSEEDELFMQSHTQEYIISIVQNYNVKTFGMLVAIRKEMTTALLYSLIRHSFLKIDEIPGILIKDYVKDDETGEAFIIILGDSIKLHKNTIRKIDSYLEFRAKYDKKIYHQKIIRSIINDRPFLINSEDNKKQITVTERDILDAETGRYISNCRTEIKDLKRQIDDMKEEIAEINKAKELTKEDEKKLENISKKLELKTFEHTMTKMSFIDSLIKDSKIEEAILKSYKEVDELIIGSRSKRLEAVSIRKIINDSYQELISNETYSVVQMLRKSAIHYCLEDLEEESSIKERLRIDFTNEQE